MPVADPSAVSEIRRRAVSAADRLGFDETRRGVVAIVATEAATNLVKHATDGEMIVREVHRGARRAVEILAIDRGPGIARLADSMRDGYSSAGSPGTGLGAIARMSSRFDITSTPGVGTLLWAEMWDDASRPADEVVEVGAVCLAIPSEHETGDAWALTSRAGACRLLVADGLGHGPEAAAAADAAVALFERDTELAPAHMLERAHAALRATRGAAVAVAELDLERGVVRFSGVGNVAASVVSAGGSRSLVSMNGTVGHVMSRAREFQEPFPEGAYLVMCTDGISNRWDVGAMPGLLSRHPALVAAAIYRDHGRPRDDSTVVVLRAPRAA